MHISEFLENKAKELGVPLQAATLIAICELEVFAREQRNKAIDASPANAGTIDFYVDVESMIKQWSQDLAIRVGQSMVQKSDLKTTLEAVIQAV